MLEDEFGYFHFKNLSVHPVATEEEALNLLFQGDTNRAVASTEMNQNSTRSHCIFTMILERRKAGVDTVVRSKLNIVDLAGSERVSRTSSEGQTLKEAKYINSSLFFLEMVIIALHEKKKKPNVHIPYRNSMMTSVLRDSLGGNCKTVMIATISPEAQHTDESISTCHFAQRVALVKNAASINEEVEPAMVIERLRAEVKRLRDEVAFLQGKNTDDGSDDEEEAGHLPQHELNELTESVSKYVHDFDERAQLDFCGGITLPKIKAVCSIFKGLIQSNKRVEHTTKSNDTDESSDEEEAANITTTPSSKARRHKGNFMHQKKDKKSEQLRKRPESKPKKVCGVPFCSDQKILDEPNAAFGWFKERYPGASALEDNKAALKTTYSEVRNPCSSQLTHFVSLMIAFSSKAKSGGKKIEEIRARVTYHKEAIERLRRNHAIDMISQGKSDDCIVTSEEKYHSDAINEEKKAYNDTIENLRKLKGTIEHQQKAVERLRTKMQSDFDLWYRTICSREISGPSMGNDNEHQRQPGSPTKVLTLDSNDNLTPTASSKQTTAAPPEPAVQTQPEKEPEFVLPPGIKLTGNKEADDDIIAFFKAKSVLLSRTKKP